MPKATLFCLAAASAILVATSSSIPAQTGRDNESRALAVVARTRTTRATFVVYNWHRIWLNGASPTEEWTAEFHSGPFDRVETPRDRVVANCQAKSGSALSLASGRMSSGSWVAAAACGVDANTPIIAAVWLGVVGTPCGKADRVTVTDAKFIRTYDISEQGMIIATTYLRNTAERSPALVDLASKCLKVLPDTRMFDEASLRASYVPNTQQRGPNDR